LFLWNPKYNCLIHMEQRRIDPAGLSSTVGFSTYWAPTYHGQVNLQPPSQCVWYRDYTGMMNGDSNRMIPPVALRFKLPKIIKDPLPEFKDGDDVYAWIVAQLD
jgi:hypothetical protein